jgi:hypothetical protein
MTSLILRRFQDVDARDKRGHDESMVGAVGMKGGKAKAATSMSRPRPVAVAAKAPVPLSRFRAKWLPVRSRKRVSTSS